MKNDFQSWLVSLLKETPDFNFLRKSPERSWPGIMELVKKWGIKWCKCLSRIEDKDYCYQYLKIDDDYWVITRNLENGEWKTRVVKPGK